MNDFVKDKPKEDKPKEDKPKEDKPKEDKPKEDKPKLKDNNDPQIKKIRKQKLENKVIEPAKYIDIDTGDKKEIDIIKADGKKEKKLTPIFKREFIEAKRQNVIIETEVYAIDDQDESHEFANERDAKEFLLLNGKG